MQPLADGRLHVPGVGNLNVFPQNRTLWRAGRRWLASDTIGPQRRGRQTTCWRHRKDLNGQNGKGESYGKGRSAS